MGELADPESAAVFDFLADYLEDREHGTVRPLFDYLGRYPGFEAAVAREYLEREGHLRPRPDADPPRDADGSARVGPYRLLRTLGHGGQGIVWLAEDTRIARRVALKVLAGGFVTTERRARFRREAESVAQLAHPGLCAVLDAEIEGERPYIAMQYVPGTTWRRSSPSAPASRCPSSPTTAAASCACAGSSSAPRARCTPPTRPAWCTATSSPRT